MATNFLEKKWENWHDFEKDAAEYFERLHQVFVKLDSRTVEILVSPSEVSQRGGNTSVAQVRESP